MLVGMKALFFGILALTLIPITSHAIELNRVAVPTSIQVATSTTPVRAVPISLPQRPAATSVTCTKTTPSVGCSAFSCSDGTKLNTCDMCSAPKISVTEGRTPPKSLITALAKPRVSTSSPTVLEVKPVVSWWSRLFWTQKAEEPEPTKCEPNYVFDSQCTLEYDCMKDLQKFSCPVLGYGGEHTWTAGWCTYEQVGYDSYSGKAQCKMICEKGEYTDKGPGSGLVSTCPAWMGITDKKISSGANDEYCKENPQDTFLCNPSAG